MLSMNCTALHTGVQRVPADRKEPLHALYRLHCLARSSSPALGERCEQAEELQRVATLVAPLPQLPGRRPVLWRCLRHHARTPYLKFTGCRVSTCNRIEVSLMSNAPAGTLHSHLAELRRERASECEVQGYQYIVLHRQGSIRTWQV